MPVLVYILLVAWLAFAGWVSWSSKTALNKLPDVYLGNDNLLMMLRGTLPPAQQKLQVRHLVLVMTSLVVLAVLIILVMIWHTTYLG
ncbi:MAG: hypothetical protein IPP83_15140 [Flavobacteriales bacterium]|nr:hypothetical protein [Flavobacteriales bacterium]